MKDVPLPQVDMEGELNVIIGIATKLYLEGAGCSKVECNKSHAKCAKKKIDHTPTRVAAIEQG